MASESDNPFARNSAWPQMPQAPFRVGPLPKADPAPAPPEPQARQTVTPVFTRPTNAAPAFSGLPAGAITRPAAQPPRPAATPAAEPVSVAPPPPPPEPAPILEPPRPAAPPEPYIELAPVIVQPLGSARRAAPRKSPVPAIAASVAGLAAVLGIAYALSRGQEAALKAPVTPPAAAVTAPPAPAVTTTPEPTFQAPAVVPPTKIAAAPRATARAAPPPRLVVPAAPAEPEAAAVAPVISLPPPVATPAPPPQPAYTPPAAPDPNAPMTTKRD